MRITEWIAGDQVRDEILVARALVLPRFAEGLVVVIMEAMTLRRPVINTSVVGIPELAQTGEHGWLVPAEAVEAVMHAMQVSRDASANVLDRLGKAAYERALARHFVDTQAAQLTKLCNTAVERRRSFSDDAQLELGKRTDAKPISCGGISK